MSQPGQISLWPISEHLSYGFSKPPQLTVPRIEPSSIISTFSPTLSVSGISTFGVIFDSFIFPPFISILSGILLLLILTTLSHFASHHYPGTYLHHLLFELLIQRPTLFLSPQSGSLIYFPYGIQSVCSWHFSSLILFSDSPLFPELTWNSLIWLTHHYNLMIIQFSSNFSPPWTGIFKKICTIFPVVCKLSKRYCLCIECLFILSCA